MFYLSNTVLKEIERNLIEMADLYAILEDINPEGFVEVYLRDCFFPTDDFYQLDSDEYPFLSYYARKDKRASY